jgi:hypothetical protein
MNEKLDKSTVFLKQWFYKMIKGGSELHKVIITWLIIYLQWQLVTELWTSGVETFPLWYFTKH